MGIKYTAPPEIPWELSCNLTAGIDQRSIIVGQACFARLLLQKHRRQTHVLELGIYEIQN